MSQNKNLKIITTPNGEKELLLHVCCAACMGPITELLKNSDIKVTFFFCNPNIYPQKEYLLRKKYVQQFALKNKIDFIESDYDPDSWKKHIKGLENEPERGKRCICCFNIRLERTAKYAHENGFKVFATTGGISRWKDMDMINTCGENAAKCFSNAAFWPYNWRKNHGSQRMYEIAKEEEFYMQHYCGCEYSM